MAIVPADGSVRLLGSYKTYSYPGDFSSASFGTGILPMFSRGKMQWLTPELKTRVQISLPREKAEQIDRFSIAVERADRQR